MAKITEPLAPLVGEQLTSIVLVRDYVQLGFDGPVLTAYVFPLVRERYRYRKRGDVGYYDALWRCIGLTVRRASSQPREEIRIEFDHATSLSVSLRPQDQIGPEAAEFKDDATNPVSWVVF